MGFRARLLWREGALLALLAAMAGACTPIYTVRDERFAGQEAEVKATEVQFVEQLTVASCGVAVLESVLKYWGVDAEQKKLLAEYPPEAPERGYTIGELKRIAADRQLKAFSSQVDLEFLERQIRSGRPLIVPLETRYFAAFFEVVLIGPLSRLLYQLLMPSFSHYVVVFAYDPERVWIMDPAHGLRALDKARFASEWRKQNNAVLLITS